MANHMWMKFSILAALAVMITMVVGCERETYDAEAVQPESDSATSNSHHYNVRVGDARVAAGDEEEVVLEVVPSPDLKINLDFPWSIELESSEDLQLGASTIDADGMQLLEEQARIPVSVTAQSAGEYEVEGRATLSVCNDDVCHILRDEPVKFVVEAAESDEAN